MLAGLAILAAAAQLSGQQGCPSGLVFSPPPGDNIFSPQQQAWLGEAEATQIEPRFRLSRDPAVTGYLQQSSSASKLVGVHVNGSRRLPEAEIAKATGLKLAEPVTPAAFDGAAKRLADTGAFVEVEYRYVPGADGYSVTFRVKDASQFVAARFANFVWMPEDQLLADLRQRVPLFDGEVAAGGGMADNIARALEALLRERGITATADYIPTQDALGRTITAFDFKVHGVSLFVQEFVFTGNAGVDRATLEKTVRPLVGQDYDQFFTEAFVRSNAGPVYLERGYLQAAFGRPQAALIGAATSSGGLKVTVAVREGLQYLLGRITWSGNSAFSSEELSAKIKLAPGQPVNGIELGKDLDDVAHLYSTRGYLAAGVKPQPTFDDDARTVSYELAVSQGDQYRMGRLQVSGIDSGHAEKLGRDCRLRPGDVFDATYWNNFLKENARDVPPNPRGWKMQIKMTTHPESRTVDVALAFSPAQP